MWVHPCFSNSVPHVLIVLLGWFYGWAVSGCTGILLFGITSRFKIACRILVKFPFSFFSMHFVSIHVVHPYSSIDTATACKKFCFILSDRSDFYMINNLSIAIHVFARQIFTLFSVDGTLLPRYMNLFTNFGGQPFNENFTNI